MTPKKFYLLLLALVAFRSVLAQNEDELQIPVENDNQFPPDNPSDIIEGSDGGVIEDPAVSDAEITEAPPIEDIENGILLDDDVDTSSQGQEDGCPKPCVCHIEESTNDFVIDCSGYDLTEFPSPLNEKATILNIQKNKITEIPQSISSLKYLKVLKANENSIATLVPGSISELSELVTLELRNNRIIEYPNDLENAFGLVKLQEIDLGGNDMQTPLTADIFTKFESLRSIILPTSTPELQKDLCAIMAKTLVKVCTGSCDQESLDCQEGSDADDLPVLPEMLQPSYDDDDTDLIIETQDSEDVGQINTEQEASSAPTPTDDLPKMLQPSYVNDDTDPIIETQDSEDVGQINSEQEASSAPTPMDDLPKMLQLSYDNNDTDPIIETQDNEDVGKNDFEQEASSAPTPKDDLPKISGESTTIGEFSFQSADDKHPGDIVSFNAPIEIAKEVQEVSETTERESTVKIDATTTDTKTGGVVSNAEITEAPPIEPIENGILLDDDVDTSSRGQEYGCPKPCVCRIEESTNDFVIDCSGYDLTEFPSPLNENATILNIQKNKITEIPQSISSLKYLKVLKANDNSIATLVPGSISELSELVTLELRNNRIIEYPNDLENAFGLVKLQEIDLGGNDMRTPLTADIFTKFESLRSIILPTSTSELQKDLCDVMAKTLVKVCTGSCDQKSLDCQEGGDADDLPVLPGMLQPSYDDDDTDPIIETQDSKDVGKNNSEQEASSAPIPKDDLPKVSGESTTTTTGEFSFRSAVNKEPGDVVSFNAPIEIAKEVTEVSETTERESTVKIGATTTDTKTGGVNTTIIGLVVVGMVVIVAVITIKKNWNSIKNRFGSNSNSRTPNQHAAGANTNGTAPEEVPLQDKDRSPV